MVVLGEDLLDQELALVGLAQFSRLKILCKSLLGRKRDVQRCDLGRNGFLKSSTTGIMIQRLR